MNFLLHGDNLTAIRNRLGELKERAQGEIFSLEGKNILPEVLSQVLQSDSLFNDKNRLIIIERPEANKTFLDNFPPFSGNINIVFVEDKKLSSTQLSKYQKAIAGLQIEEFKQSPIVFKFLESIKPGGQKTFLALWQDYQSSEEPEVILMMLVRQFRLLLLASDSSKHPGDDYKKLAPWQQDRLKTQAKTFSIEQLQTIYQTLLDIDYQNKTGQSLLSLSASLQIFLLGI